MQNELRVLTGVHAGARLQLNATRYRIGRDTDAQIRLTDWHDVPLTIETDDDGTLRYRTDDDTLHGLLAAFEPVRFGSVVLCVGPADRTWPDDLALLGRLLHANDAPPRDAAAPPVPAPARRASNARARRALACGAVAVSMLIAAPFLRFGAESRASNVPDTRLALDATSAALRRMRLDELHASLVGGTLVVDGIAPDAAAATAVHRLLQRQPVRSDARFAVASTIVENIRESLDNRDLDVRYTGDGVFAVTGSTADARHALARVAEVRSDLGAGVRRIDVAIDAADPAQKTPSSYDAALGIDGLRYVETPDGTKHFVGGTQ
ncbi:serine kinase [Burkholderia pyrrocinia]|uniref:Serine kinase n=1 Tax=Burkholderia pyrrocinia TaxID=60550 RepID=A0A2Z5NA62_BURPY|nr:HrpD5 family protein [Burkholderia pyrrocinia]AXF25798.1 serine kinase [Burkholderia pyrrocinia]